MSYYTSGPPYDPSHESRIGVLLTNLGTPDAPTARALRPYLRQFLWDRRVIELPRVLWWLILNLFVLPFRPRSSARLYSNIWTPEGSPLLTTLRAQAAAVEERIRQRLDKNGDTLSVAVGMRYGEPSIPGALRELRHQGCSKILVFPLYPQYSAATTASTFDAIALELLHWRWVPEIRTLHHYYQEPGYIAALAASVREFWSREGEPQRLLLSFHGIPQRYSDNGDPYYAHCQETLRLLKDELSFPRDRILIAFQSRFGPEEWLQPYTDKTLEGLAKSGVKRVDVLCPGFSADCLETIDEIAEMNRDLFLEAGGEKLGYIPALNERSDHIELLSNLVLRGLAGWT